MMEIPDLSAVDVAFGQIKHMPRYVTLTEEFQRGRHDMCDFAQGWFFGGCGREGDHLTVKNMTIKPRDGVDAAKALAAVKAVLGSFEPKHEHKIAACGFMLNEWFEKVRPLPAHPETER